MIHPHPKTRISFGGLMSDQEHFYQALLDNIADGIYFVDRDRRITYWNKGAEDGQRDHPE
jgi:PAS domain-containing protein